MQKEQKKETKKREESKIEGKKLKKTGRNGEKINDFKHTPNINEVLRSRIIHDEEVKHIVDRQGYLNDRF